jgi:predicted metal-dependent phosphoesterase TrpH
VGCRDRTPTGRSRAPTLKPTPVRRSIDLSARRIDLHTHSTASDGTTLPGQLVEQAREAGLDVVSLTDHDTTAGVDAASAALPAGLTLVPGAEISCVSDGISLHLLAYLFDRDEPVFAGARRALRESRRSRAERIVASLAGTGVTWEQVAHLAAGTVGRPHIAQALVERGLVPTVTDAFTPEWIGTGGRHWAGKLELDVADAVRMVAAAGGVSVFAHPGAAARGRTVPDEVYADLAAIGLAGLEVEHVDHDDRTRAHLRGLAGELGLLVTGSSDFHGGNKAVALGECTTDEAAYEQLVDRASGAPVLTA